MSMFWTAHFVARCPVLILQVLSVITPTVTVLASGVEKRKTINRPTVYAFPKTLVQSLTIVDVWQALLAGFLHEHRLYTYDITTGGAIFLALPKQAQDAEKIRIVMGVSELRLTVPVSLQGERDWDGVAHSMSLMLRTTYGRKSGRY